MADYSVTISEASRELSAKERIAFKDTTACTKLDEVTAVEPITIYPIAYAVLDIHNEKSDDKDYKNYVIVDKDNEKYVTGSNSFFNSFMEIYSEMENEDEEWGIKIYRAPSKNYSGKSFITCTIV